MVARYRIIRTGSTRGILLPSSLLRRCGIGARVDVREHRLGLLVCPAKHPRAGWDEQFARIAALGDDDLWDTDPLEPADSW